MLALSTCLFSLHNTVKTATTKCPTVDLVCPTVDDVQPRLQLLTSPKARKGAGQYFQVRFLVTQGIMLSGKPHDCILSVAVKVSEDTWRPSFNQLLYTIICNVWAIPTYGVYRLYDKLSRSTYMYCVSQSPSSKFCLTFKLSHAHATS